MRVNRAQGPAIILVRPQLAVNVGMCARAMANFGLCDLRLVAPRGGWPRIGDHEDVATAAAAGAVHLLDAAKVFATVEDAVADLHFVWATTARERGQAKRVAAPAEAMPETAAAMASGQAHGILFGPERTGLDNNDIALADAVVTFPVNPAYASLNLAQAVLLMGYEFLQATGVEAPPFDLVERSPPAPREMVVSFFSFLEDELEKAGYFRPIGKAPVMRRNLRNIFHRLKLSEQDVRTLRGAFVRLVEGPREAAAARRHPASDD
jgi:tRNA/rRNA methyltransferase